jgi:hypothetical protein
MILASSTLKKSTSCTSSRHSKNTTIEEDWEGKQYLGIAMD